MDCDLLTESAKTQYFAKATEKGIMTNKEFWKVMKPALSNKGVFSSDVIMEASILFDTPPPGRVEIPGGRGRFFRKSPHPRGRKFSEFPTPGKILWLKLGHFLAFFRIYV